MPPWGGGALSPQGEGAGLPVLGGPGWAEESTESWGGSIPSWEWLLNSPWPLRWR